MGIDTSSYLQKFQALLSMPRETLPQLTAAEARKALGWASEALRLELVEIEGAAPTFLLLPEPGSTPAALFFTTWHAEVLQVTPAAVEGAERLARSATLAGLGRQAETEAEPRAAAGAAPGATQGSLVPARSLRADRARLPAPLSFRTRPLPNRPR